jgi:hypothetical protein
MRIEQIKAWIDSPDYMHEFEKARSKRLAETGEWLISSPLYLAWRSFRYQDKDGTGEMLSEDISKANLFLTGKWKTKVN